jgi:hypothetical protein
MGSENPGIKEQKLQIELRRIELDAEMRRAELHEKQATRESDERNQAALNELKRRELELVGGTGLRFTTAQATVMAAVFALLGGALGAFIQAYVTGKSGIELERQKLETTLILNATKSDNLDDRINNLKFLVDAGLIQDERAKIGELIKKRAVPSTPRSTSDLTTPLFPRTGTVTLFDGFGQGWLTAVDFSSGKISPWGGDPGDIAALNPDKTKKALIRFFVPNDSGLGLLSPTKEVVYKSGIVDMGEKKSLDEVPEAPTSFTQGGQQGGYFDAVPGHVYCVRTRDGLHYAKLRILFVGTDRMSFDYVYQPSGSRRFSGDNTLH